MAPPAPAEGSQEEILLELLSLLCSQARCMESQPVTADLAPEPDVSAGAYSSAGACCYKPSGTEVRVW